MSTEKYYMDLFNQPGKAVLSHTMRLYVKPSDDTNAQEKLILVAPLLQMPEIMGQNSWSTVDKSFKDLIGEAWSDAVNRVNSIKMGIANNLLSASSKNSFDLRRRSSMVMDSPVGSLKTFEGTDIQVPTNISVTYYSSDAKDFSWFEGGDFVLNEPAMTKNPDGTIDVRGYWKNGKTDSSEVTTEMENQPLKYIAKKLIPICLGYLDNSEVKDNGSTGTGLNTLAIRAPGGYATPTHKWESKGTAGTFKLCIGTSISITGLLPTSIEIKPSRMLTDENDYYYMTVNIGLQMGRRYYSDELVSWIGGNSDIDKLMDTYFEKDKSSVKDNINNMNSGNVDENIIGTS